MHRVAMSDSFHCLNSAAELVWSAKKGSGTEPSNERGGFQAVSDSESDASSGDSDEADGHAYVFAPLQAWISMIRLFRAKFRRGINLSHLRSAFSAAGVTPSSVQGPSSTRMVVYSSRFLRQSFSHYRIRWSAVLRAWGHARGCGARRPSAADKRNIAVISTSVRVLAFNLFGLANKVLPPKCAEMSSCLIRV